MSRAAPSGGGRQGRVSPRAGAAGACPRTISRTPRDGNIRQRAHTPGDGVWVAPPPPAGTHYTPPTHDQGPSASSHKGCARMSAAPRTHQQHYRQNLPACRDVFRSLFAARLHWLATAHACSARSPVCESWHLTLRTSSLSVRTTRGYGGAKPWLPVTLLTRRTATAFDP